MKRKLLVIGMVAALVSFMVVFVGCPQEVKVMGVAKADNVSEVTVRKASNVGTYTTDYAIIEWKAVDNAVGYTVVWQQEDKKSFRSIASSGGGGSQPQNEVRYDASGLSYDGAGKKLFCDVDEWSYLHQVDRYDAATVDNKTKDPSEVKGKSVRFGVITHDYRAGLEQSDIEWSDYVKF